MYGDYSRDSFDPTKQFTRVLMQQGRPLTDADWNEQAASLLYEQRELIRGLVPWHGTTDRGFRLQNSGNTLQLCDGSYYVDGLRCTASRPCLNPAFTNSKLEKSKDYLIYLEVWEQALNILDDEDIADPALQLMDVSYRTQTRWWVRIGRTANDNTLNDREQLLAHIDSKPPNERRLQAQRRRPIANQESGVCGSGSTTPSSPSGAEWLYRLEIHKSGVALDVDATGEMLKVEDVATFKWSRVNGAAVYSVQSPKTDSKQLLLDGNRMSSTFPIRTDDRIELLRSPGYAGDAFRRLLRVADGRSGIVTDGAFKPTAVLPGDVVFSAATRAAREGEKYYVRCWNNSGPELDPATTTQVGGATVIGKNRTLSNQSGRNADSVGKPDAWGKLTLSTDGGALVITSSNLKEPVVWLELENNIFVRFPDKAYREGDYWLIRVTAGGTQVIWPIIDRETQTPQMLPPVGYRHYAPLAVMNINGQEAWTLTRKRNRLRGLALQDDDVECEPTSRDCSPPPTSQAPASPPAGGGAVSGSGPTCRIDNAPRLDARSPSLLSSAGKLALKRYAASPTGLTRRIPARYLNHETRSPGLKRWLRTALVSEIHEPDFERFFDKVLRSVAVPEEERPLVEEEAREVYGLATSLRQIVSCGGGIRELIA